MKKILLMTIVIIVLAGAGIYFYVHNEAKAPADETNEYQAQSTNSNPLPPSSNPAPNGQTNTINNTTTPDYTPPQSASGGEVAAPNIQVTEVDYDGAQFTPNSVNIKVNDWVFFKNKSTVDFWPASNPHPTHTDYPGFDALKAIAPGGEYKFQFTKVGNWGYQNHLSPDQGGVIHVSQ